MRSLRRDRPDPAPALDGWRRRRLLEAGLPRDLAAVAAEEDRYDLHALLGLIDRGCAPELAVRIVAPLDEEPPAC